MLCFDKAAVSNKTVLVNIQTENIKKRLTR